MLRAPTQRQNSVGSGLLRLKLPKFNKQDPRLQYVLTQLDPFVNFVLYAATQSSPNISVYTPVNTKAKMTMTTHEFLSKEIELIGCDSYDNKQQIRLPKVLSWYQKDFGNNEQEMLDNLLPYLPEAIRAKVKFFSSTLKVRYKDYKWNIGSYMGSKLYDFAKINEEIKLEHQSTIQNKIAELQKLKVEAARKEDYDKAQVYKEKEDALKQKLANIT